MLSRAVSIHRPAAAARAVALVAGIGAAATLRVALGGASPAASRPAALVFAAALLILAAAAGVRPGRPAVRDVCAGVLGGASLWLAWALTHASFPALRLAHGGAALLQWSLLVTCVAVSEEIVLRGALFDAVQHAGGVVTALLVTTTVFAVIHAPLYGLASLPVDLGVGLCLGGLRLLSGGVAAPAAAHAVADLAAGWLS